MAGVKQVIATIGEDHPEPLPAPAPAQVYQLGPREDVRHHPPGILALVIVCLRTNSWFDAKKGGAVGSRDPLLLLNVTALVR